MNVQCDKCHKRYDDAKKWTICPHEQFLSDTQFARKDLAISLIGKDLYFAHRQEGEMFHISTVTWEGMVTLDNLPGEFTPGLFVVAK